MQKTILENIILYKKKWVNYKKKINPLINFKYKIKESTRNFYNSLISNNCFFIFECKKKSPSKGNIRDIFEPSSIVEDYKNYASAISVLTDEKYFHGNFNYLKQISNVVTQPILCKDFFIDIWQIYFARLHNADAILLMLSVLDDDSYIKLASVAHSLNMGILTEVINKKEIERALKLGAKVIGINNRNLHDLSIDLNRTRKLTKNLPKEIIVISESGINNYKQVLELSNYVNGFLIGSSIMSEQDINFSVRSILFGENKVCGLTRVDDARAVFEYGAIYGGLIFIKESSRLVNKESALKIISGAPLRYVGVFSDAPISFITDIALSLKLFAVQLHGKENQKYIYNLRKNLISTCYIWKALDINLCFKNIPLLDKVDKYLLDIGHGGSGYTFDWSILEGISLNYIILAGGLGPNNCRIASRLGCAGLDFNSGVEDERTPGIKNHNKLSTVFNILRTY